MKRFTIFSLVLLFSLTLQAQNPTPHIYKNPTADELPILAWFSLLGEEVSKERYKEMAEAGFNISFSHIASVEDVYRSLDEAKGTGVKVLVGYFGDNMESVLRKVKRHPSTAGYFLRDEPNADGFAELRVLADRIRAVDDSKMLYLNLLPNYVTPQDLRTKSYAEYVARFIKEVGLGLVSFDHYPVTVDGLRDIFYANLEDIAHQSRLAGVPFWAFALTTAHGPYPVPTREALRLQIFSNLAYGAQGIQYFTYTTPLGTAWDFHNAPIDEKSQRTEVYDLVKELNLRVQGLNRVWLGAEVVSVGHTGKKIPVGCSAVKQLPKGIKIVESDGIGLLVSHLRNGEEEYLMVVNRDLNNTQRVKVVCDEGVKRVMDGDIRIAAATYSDSLNLGAGDMLLFEL